VARQHQRRIEASLKQTLDRSDRRSDSEEAGRMQRFIEHLAGKRRIYQSQPALFHYPGLPSIEFYQRELFPWLPELEAQTPVIQRELAAVLADRDSAGLEPYIQIPAGQPLEQWGELDRSPRWSAYHFSFYGEDYADHRQQCPNTAAILDDLPQPRIPRRSPAALFSILEPHTHIPPHHGAANTRLLCHLPLILPNSCRLRVGNEIRAWQLGEAMIFDDTIEHEAWNDSDQIRVVLIFDIWNPFLSPAERDLVVRSLGVLDQLNGISPGMPV
jgi:aspartyl/asparaginyl beta-hydroxylase (cupin superfamily)